MPKKTGKKGRGLNVDGTTAMVVTAICSGGAVAALVSGIFSVVMWKFPQKAQIQAQKTSKEDDIAKGIRMLLYDRIKHLGNSYMHKGYVTSEELEDLTAMHHIYHNNLNGNGFLDDLMSRVKNLPIK